MPDEMERKDFLKKGWMGLLAPFFQEVDKERMVLPGGTYGTQPPHAASGGDP